MAHCAKQRSYMPIYPAPNGLMLDGSRLGLAAMPSHSVPHILVAPSDLRHLAEEVAQVAADRNKGETKDVQTSQQTDKATLQSKGTSMVVVNPARLCKPSGNAGTFARINAKISSSGGVSGTAPMQCSTKVEIVRI